MKTDYTRIARADDLPSSRDHAIYRALEMLPGTLAWSTILLGVLGSWLFPVWTAMFIIFFVVYWLFRTLYFTVHLKSGFSRMQKHRNMDWMQELESLDPKDYSLKIQNWRDLLHLVAIPAYQESPDILRQTLLGLQRASYPSSRMIVVLGIEERAGKDAEDTAALMQREFQDEFFRFLVTKHPAGLEGEIPGKGSNETWALKQAVQEVLEPLKTPPEQVIVTSLDADTVIGPEYFSCLTYHFLTNPKPLRHSYQPVPLFINNIWGIPFLSRLFAFTTTFWYAMNQERPEKLSTFSSHSMSLRALLDVGFKQENVVSDDSRIFWQCFFAYNGDYAVQPLYYPVSMDANAAPSLLRTIMQIYKQQRRWAYGAENIPYVLFGFLKNRRIPLGKKIALGFELMDTFWSWATASLLIFMLGWLPLLLGGQEFSSQLLSYNLPRFVSSVLTISMAGLVFSVYLSMLLLPNKTTGRSKKERMLIAFQWVFLPPLMVLMAIPALESQTRLLLKRYLGFWPTPKYRENTAPAPSSI